MDDLLSEFVTETVESLDVANVELVKLEQEPNDQETLSNIFRLVHTIKGTCGFLGLPRLQAIAHAGENVLGLFRDGKLEVTQHAVTLVLECLDRVRAIVAHLERTGAEPEGDDNDLIAQLDDVAEGGSGEGTAEAAPEVAQSETAAPAPEAEPEPESAPVARPIVADDSLFKSIGGPIGVDAVVDILFAKITDDERLKTFYAKTDIDGLKLTYSAYLTTALGGPVRYSGKSLAKAHESVRANGLASADLDLFFGYFREAMRDFEIEDDVADKVMAVIESGREDILKPVASQKPAAKAPAAQVAEQAPKAKAQQQSQPKAKPADMAGQGLDTTAANESSVANQTIRVNVEVLEDLMTMVSEMVLTRNQLMQMVRRLDDSEFNGPLQRLNQCTTELQEAVMKTRMQPIGSAWAKLPRIVRDLARDLDKKIELKMLGADTELDRQVLELIKDPLTHMVRNSADHGLETTEERVESGKSEIGQVTLNAFHEGGHIIIEVSDDGRGLNIEKIKKKILANGLASEADVAAMSDQQVQRYIFHAGFSTAETVTNVSGRGVGMDVVRTNIEKIGGTIDLKSERGRGTKFMIKIPLTLAIVSALIVESSGERFAIPQLSVVELVRAGGNSGYKIERINQTPVLRLRDRLLPLVHLRDVLNLPPRQVEAEASPVIADNVTSIRGVQARRKSRNEDYVVVTQVGNLTYGIVVDQVYDTEEIVVKPVARILRNLAMYSGNTILGDGSVIMILDPNGIAAKTGDIQIGSRESTDATATRRSKRDEATSFLVFKAGNQAPKAVPLALVARLENVDANTIEHTEAGDFVQYRGSLMPVLRYANNAALKTEGLQPILVFSDDNHIMGLAVDEIVDIVEQVLDIEMASSKQGVLGTAVIGGKATEVIDVSYYAANAYPDWFRKTRYQTQTGGARKLTRLLLVDDSAFFRGLLEPLLARAGYDVMTANSAADALRTLESGDTFDLIVSDIEMPGMNGFDFASAVKSDARWKSTPMIALSSYSAEPDVARGRSVGFSDYVAKFDREALMNSLSRVLSQHEEAA